MRSSNTYPKYRIPTEIDKIWVTHLPNFSIKEYKVINVLDDNKQIKIVLEDSKIFNNTIILKERSNDIYEMKRCYHLTEIEAAERLQAHYEQLMMDNNLPVIENIVADADCIELLRTNIELFVVTYPEMII